MTDDSAVARPHFPALAGTLLDTEALATECMQVTVDPFGKQMTWEIKQNFLGLRPAEWAPTLIKSESCCSRELSRGWTDPVSMAFWATSYAPGQCLGDDVFMIAKFRPMSHPFLSSPLFPLEEKASRVSHPLPVLTARCFAPCMMVLRLA